MSEHLIRVLVVDDSSLMRQILTEVLNGVPDIKVVAQAPDPYAASDILREQPVDVMTLDVEMPRMDGLSFLEKVMMLRPVPVIMISTLTAQGADSTLRALEYGAVDYVAKPTHDLRKNLNELAEELRQKVRIAAKARIRPYRGISSRLVSGERNTLERLGPEKLEAKKAAVQAATNGHAAANNAWLFAIGASTGGVEAVTTLLTQMPPDCPPILITQHMPEKFTTSFAQRLNSICQIVVEEAAHSGTLLQPGHAYVAPGGYHLEIERKSGGAYAYKTQQEPPVNGHRPAVDVMFRSILAQAGKHVVAALLTGMGKDGAEGLLALRRAGAATFGQDEASCVVYGMPKAAFDLGAVEKQLPIGQIGAAMLERFKRLTGK